MVSVNLKWHTFKGQRVQSSTKQCPTRSDSRRTGSDVAMQKAVTAIKQKGVSLHQAAKMNEIPRSTLHDHVTGQVEHSVLPGLSPYLTREEEELVAFLIRCAGLGYLYRWYQIMAIVQEILKGKGIQASISDEWWDWFKKCHPQNTLRIAAPLSFAWAMATDRESLNSYYVWFARKYLEKQWHFLNNASRIFNCDETYIPLNPPSPKVLHAVGEKNSCYVTGGTEVQVTVLACASAAGYTIPPFVIFDRQTIN